MSQSIPPVLTEQPVDNLPTLTFEEYRFYEGELDVQYELYKGKLIPMPIATVWLGLCPGSRITGGKVKSSHTRQVVNRAANAFRLAAQSLSRSQSALGAFYRRLRARLGG